MDAPRFSVEELVAIEESARSRLFGKSESSSDLIGFVIDLSRALRHEIESRLGTSHA